MEEPLKLLFKILLALIGGVSALIALCLVLFTAIMFIVPTSSPYQVEEWQQTMVTIWGMQMTQLSLKRLQVAALGISLIIPSSAIAVVSFWLLNKQR